MDKEKIFDALRNCITEPKCKDCPWETCEKFHQTKTLPLDLCLDILKLLKEQEEQIKNRDESLEKAQEEIEWLRGMLKEQEEKLEHLNSITLEYEKEVFRLQNLLKEQEAVVRCLDCKFAELCEIAYRFGERDDWFCADGERENNE